MDLHEIVDDAHALASSIECGEIEEAMFRAGRIATAAAADEALGIVLAAHRVITALATPRSGETELGAALIALSHTIESRIGPWSDSMPGWFVDCQQVNRRGNLRAVLEELEDEGIVGVAAKAHCLQVNPLLLENMLNGGYIPDAFAREVEWVMQRRAGWMDEVPHTRDL
ncbi:hypothetical protein L2Y96_12435 [Luteibacter aegosomaticola]|uniref:hypothetical protein n=1 Tax=Luteibacter aegosomaticola TaxID=2911538 RepID=UPI001FF736D8|nr:hypothetical protein [Luteibacter aegosomaticola]UPG88227.1 hypothetical protein L2Y96_12435 [Luteibacter aegosomaticola]